MSDALWTQLRIPYEKRIYCQKCDVLLAEFVVINKDTGEKTYFCELCVIKV